jgi:hypothetical protein
MFRDHKSLIIINLGKSVQMLRYICVGITNKRKYYAVQHHVNVTSHRATVCFGSHETSSGNIHVGVKITIWPPSDFFFSFSVDDDN